MKKRLIVVGGHGSGEIAMSVFQEVNSLTNEWIIEGFLNDIVDPGNCLGKYKVIGPTDAILDYVNKGYHIHYTLHFNAKNKEQRVDKFKSLNIPLEANATVVHPRAHIDPSTEIGFGTMICANASTSFGPKIGNFVHVYTNGFVGHDSTVGDYATVAAHSVIGGRIDIDTGAHIGLNSCIREDLRIGKFAIVGMGAVVTKPVEDYAIVAGNPAKVIGSVK
ncbi:MAG: hypothetical protein C0617_07955 [Desulfuromonas sp.]|uniref:hypothetical protein n=1 Tax=Desulfuromonas sp. TaxID=892 RepID=UPI000CC5233D|nr:hypothetical protein [Desulfuromonas sp.]PLX84411.1 MAG: hypothetical protein C0617_07955 [Desulfuromonas sp.]